jgi:hypothetical protein
VAAFCFIVAGLVAIRVAVDGVIGLFAGKSMYKPGYYRVVAPIGVVALAAGVVFTLAT